MTTTAARPLGWRARALELACSCTVALPFVALAATRPSERFWLAVGLSLAVAARTLVNDLERHVVPRRFVIGTAAVPLAWSLAEALGGDVWRVVDVVLGASAMGGPIALIHAAAPAWFGFGDVALAGALGATLGLISPAAGIPALLIACSLGLVWAWERRTRSVPFAPALLAGAATVAWASGVTGIGLA